MFNIFVTKFFAEKKDRLSLRLLLESMGIALCFSFETDLRFILYLSLLVFIFNFVGFFKPKTQH